jgi:hypothetical protein
MILFSLILGQVSAVTWHRTDLFAHESLQLLTSIRSCDSELVLQGRECVNGHNIKYINKLIELKALD